MQVASPCRLFDPIAASLLRPATATGDDECGDRIILVAAMRICAGQEVRFISLPLHTSLHLASLFT